MDVWINLQMHMSSDRPFAKVPNFVQGLIKPNLQIRVTGRPETDIKDVLDRSSSGYISLHDKGGQRTKDGYQGPHQVGH